VPDISLGGTSHSPVPSAMDAIAVKALRDLNK